MIEEELNKDRNRTPAPRKKTSSMSKYFSVKTKKEGPLWKHSYPFDDEKVEYSSEKTSVVIKSHSLYNAMMVYSGVVIKAWDVFHNWVIWSFCCIANLSFLNHCDNFFFNLYLPWWLAMVYSVLPSSGRAPRKRRWSTSSPPSAFPCPSSPSRESTGARRRLSFGSLWCFILWKISWLSLHPD